MRSRPASRRHHPCLQAAAGRLLGILLLGVATPAAAERHQYRLDPERTSITFFTHHLGYADAGGMFLESEDSFIFVEEAKERSDRGRRQPAASSAATSA
jgi:polyisoprenoid-binding protein YceI